MARGARNPAAATAAAAGAAAADAADAAVPKKPVIACKGSVSYAEVSSAAASVGDFEASIGRRSHPSPNRKPKPSPNPDPNPNPQQVTSKYKKAPGAKLKARADAGVALLRLEVLKAVEAFAAELKTKSV